MKTHTIDLPELLDAFVAERIAAGEYRDVESVIVASLLRDKAEADAEAVKTERFWAKIKAATDSLDRGQGYEVTDIEAFLEEIEAELDADELGAHTVKAA